MKYRLLVSLVLLLIFLYFLPISLREMKIQRMSNVVASDNYSAIQSEIIVPDNYTSIQSAIDATPEGGVILVRNGTFIEHITITKSLEIYGSDEFPTILRSDWNGNVVSIKAVSVTFAGFQVEGTGGGSFGAGIYTEQSLHNRILNNTVSGNKYGVYFWDCFNITLRNNNITNNLFNFGVWGLTLDQYQHDVDASNLVEGKPVYYWLNEENKTVPLDAGYVALVNSTNISVKDLRITNNLQGVVISHSVLINVQNVTSIKCKYGIHMVASNHTTIVQSNLSENTVGLLLDLSSNNYIAENDFFDNGQGVMLSYSPLLPLRSNENYICRNNITRNGDGIQIAEATNNRICGNEIIANNRYGILASSSSYNIFCENTLSTNNYGIYFEKKSGDNLVYNNNFINNTSHVYTVDTTNLWNLSKYVGGNYWSGTVIIDEDADGIVDFSKNINDYNIDWYPLAGTFSNHTISWDDNEYFIATICNSTELVLEFFPQQHEVSVNFSGPNGTLGFCRISIKKELITSLWQDNLTILVNGEPPPHMVRWDDDELVYIYFTYLHPNSQALLIPEFPSVAFYLALFFIVSSITLMILVKKTSAYS